MSYQAYLDAIEKKSGRTPDALLAEAAERGFTPSSKAGDFCAWLAESYGVGRGHAMALWGVLKNGSTISDKHVGSSGTHRDPPPSCGSTGSRCAEPASAYRRGLRLSSAVISTDDDAWWRSPIGEHLGLRVLAVDPEAGTVEVSFEAREEFLNFSGVVQGGIVAAMLDATMGPVLRATAEPGEVNLTADLQVRCFASARLGTLVGRGRIDRRGRSIVFVSAELYDEAGVLLASATSTCVARRPR
jgi:uncharacterized protein (TIGR00369 family)